MKNKSDWSITAFKSPLIGDTQPNTNSMKREEVDKSEMVGYSKWYEMIPRNSMTLDHSTPGLLIRTMHNTSRGTSFMYLTQSGQVQISDFTPNYTKHYWSSCNGFLLDTCATLRPFNTCNFELMITNPATNQRLHLPPFIDPTQRSHSSSAIGYVATRMEYKVVRTYWPVHPYTVRPSSPMARINCAILTVGVDNVWRLVDTQHLSLATCQHFKMNPLVTEGFVHWAPHDWHFNGCMTFSSILTPHESSNFVLTLNVETETVSRFAVPRCIGGYYYYRYLSTGERNLSLVIGRGHLKWNVWEMNPETGGWSMLPDIDLEAHKGLLNESYDREEGPFKPGDGDHCLDCKLIPAGWLKYPTVMVFVVYRPMRGKKFGLACLRVVYNIQTHDITLFMLDQTYHPYLFHRHNQLLIPAT